MTDTEINIAIAQACGWKKQAFGGTSWWSNPPKNNQFDPPNYCTDLNAMSMIIPLVTHNRTHFVEVLWDLQNESPEPGHWVEVAWACVTSTARQQAEAWLKTKGLWKEIWLTAHETSTS